jgi:hypothetical protein
VIFLPPLSALSFFPFQLHWSFEATWTDAPVASIHDIPWGDVRDELMLVVGRL